ncbi:hypothetical protein D1872_315230 [compost metagenome]
MRLYRAEQFRSVADREQPSIIRCPAAYWRKYRRVIVCANNFVCDPVPMRYIALVERSASAGLRF